MLVVIFLVSSVGLDSGSGPPATDEQVSASTCTFPYAPQRQPAQHLGSILFIGISILLVAGSC